MSESSPDDQQDAVSEKDELKAARREREKEELLASLAVSDFSAMKTKVAAILNLYPHPRKSQVLGDVSTRYI